MFRSLKCGKNAFRWFPTVPAKQEFWRANNIYETLDFLRLDAIPTSLLR